MHLQWVKHYTKIIIFTEEHHAEAARDTFQDYRILEKVDETKRSLIVRGKLNDDEGSDMFYPPGLLSEECRDDRLKQLARPA